MFLCFHTQTSCCCYMQVWANNANVNKRHLRLSFPTCNWHVANGASCQQCISSSEFWLLRSLKQTIILIFRIFRCQDWKAIFHHTHFLSFTLPDFEIYRSALKISLSCPAAWRMEFFFKSPWWHRLTGATTTSAQRATNTPPAWVWGKQVKVCAASNIHTARHTYTEKKTASVFHTTTCHEVFILTGNLL